MRIVILLISILGLKVLSFGQMKEVQKKSVSECQTNCPCSGKLVAEFLNQDQYGIKIGGIFNCIISDETIIEYKLHSDSLTIKVHHSNVIYDTVIEDGNVVTLNKGYEQTACECYFYINLAISDATDYPNYIIVNHSTIFRRKE